MKKLYKSLVLFLALVATFSFLCVGANASMIVSSDSVPVYRLYLYLGPYGATDVSYDRLKVSSYPAADIQELRVTTQYSGGVWLRIRDSQTYNAATYAQEIFYYDSSWRPVYWDGYGIVGNEYYIKGQTSSASAYNASVTGYWIP